MPESPDGISGYHPTCYWYFTSVRSKKPAEVTENNRKKPIVLFIDLSFHIDVIVSCII